MPDDATDDATDDAEGVDALLELLDLRRLGDDMFEAVATDDGWHRLFGGQVASQSLRAATLTVDASRPVHSLHAYFIRPGRSGVPLHLTVDRTRDGRSFTTRRVTARQGDEAIFIMDASFHAAEEGEDWQLPAPPAAGVQPESLASRPWSTRRFSRPFELRTINDPGEDGFPAMHPFWVRADGRLPDDRAIHACAMAYMSDMGVVPASRAPGLPRMAPGTGGGMGASLDHSLWFHRPARADEWLFFTVEPVSNYGARALARGGMFDAAGRHVLSLSQETLLRRAR